MILSSLLALGLAQCDPYTRSHVDDTQLTSPCLFWLENSAVEFRINDQGNPENLGDVEFTAVTAALATWQTQLDSCGSLHLSVGAKTTSRLASYLPGSGSNQNVVLWRFKNCSTVVPANDPCLSSFDCGDKYDCWDYPTGAVAITSNHYEGSTGQLLDSDIELNTPNFLFTTVDSPVCVAPNFNINCVATDIQNTLTHEFGHALGLAHNCTVGSTMGASTVPGELSKRVLDNGSKLAMCQIYPKSAPALRCGTALDGGSGGSGGSGGGSGGTGGGSGGSGGGSGGTGGGSGGTGGAGGGGNVQRGCGCAEGPGGMLGLGLLGLLARRLTARRARAR